MTEALTDSIADPSSPSPSIGARGARLPLDAPPPEAEVGAFIGLALTDHRWKSSQMV